MYGELHGSIRGGCQKYIMLRYLPRRHPHRMSEIYTARNIPRRYPCRMFKMNPIRINPRRHPFRMINVSASEMENISLPGCFRRIIHDGLPKYIYVQITLRKYPWRVSKNIMLRYLPRRHPHRMSEIYTARNIPRRYPCRMFKINPIQISPRRHPFWLAKISTSDIENMSFPGSFRGSIRNGLPNYIYIQITPRKYPQRVSKIYPVAVPSAEASASYVRNIHCSE